MGVCPQCWSNVDHRGERDLSSVRVPVFDCSANLYLVIALARQGSDDDPSAATGGFPSPWPSRLQRSSQQGSGLLQCLESCKDSWGRLRHRRPRFGGSRSIAHHGVSSLYHPPKVQGGFRGTSHRWSLIQAMVQPGHGWPSVVDAPGGEN